MLTDTAYTLQVLTFILIILAALLLLVGMNMLRRAKSNGAKPGAQQASQAALLPRAPAPVGGVEAGVAAAITAAITCMLEQEGAQGAPQGFVVRRIRRI